MNDSVNETNFSEEKVAFSEKMRYQPNTLSYYIGFLGLILNIVFLFMATSKLEIDVDGLPEKIFSPLSLIGVKILGNVLIMFISFLGMEKMRAYQSKWNYIIIVLGGLFIFRIFWIPRIYFGYGEVLTGTILTVLILISAACYVTAGVIATIKTKMLNSYLKSINELK